MSRYWEPAVTHRDRRYARRPEVGWVIAVNRKPWIVLDVREHDADSEFEYEVGLRPLDNEKHYGIRVPRHAWSVWHALPEHFAICHSCGELASCRDHERAIYAAEQSKRMERELKLLPGCCPACQREHIDADRPPGPSRPQLRRDLLGPSWLEGHFRVA